MSSWPALHPSHNKNLFLQCFADHGLATEAHDKGILCYGSPSYGACPRGARQVTCGKSRTCWPAQISNTAHLKHPRVAYLSTPRHLGGPILFLSRKDKAAFIVFRSFNESDRPCQREFLSVGSNLRPLLSYNFPSASRGSPLS